MNRVRDRLTRDVLRATYGGNWPRWRSRCCCGSRRWASRNSSRPTWCRFSIKGLNSDLLIGSDAVDQVRVELRGPTSKLRPSSLTDLAILIDLSGSARAARTPTFTLSGTDLHLSPGVTFIRAVPSQLRVPIARKVSKDVPVQIQIGAPPPAGYHVTGMDASPAVVRIDGPEPRVGPITSAQTEAIDLSHSTSATEVHVNVFVADTRVGLESDPVVTVRFNIEKDKTTQ